MEPEIVISYREDMPKHLVLEVANDLRRNGFAVATEEEEIREFAAIEWAIPAAIAILIAKAYVDGIVKEIGKDHYHYLKKKAGELAGKAAPIELESVVSSNSPNKVSPGNRVSKAFALHLQTLDSRNLKFLFPAGADSAFSTHCSDRIFEMLLEHANEFPTDQLSNETGKVLDERQIVYMLFDEESDTWRAVDIHTESFLD